MGSELAVANVGNEPTFCNAIREKVLDLTLANRGALNFFGNWRVSDESSLSDHTDSESAVPLRRQPGRFTYCGAQTWSNTERA